MPQIEAKIRSKDSIPEGTFHSPDIGIEPLQSAEINAYRRVINSGILGMPYKSLEQRQEQVAKRTEEYFHNALEDLDFTLLAAKDESGNIIGGLEAKTIIIDGKRVGFVHWICVDEANRTGGVATKVYRAYEQMMREKGHIFAIMAYVDDENTPSLNLHKKLGITAEFNRNDKGAWYFKPL